MAAGPQHRAAARGPARAAVILVAVVAVKLAIVLLVIPNLAIVSQGNYGINNLPDSYPQIANNLIQGNGYRVRPDTAETMIRPPVNVFLLAAIFSIFGVSLAAVQVINVLLTVAGGLLLVKLLRRHTDGPVPWIAAAIYVLHPGIMLAETRGGVEVPITFLMVLFVFALDSAFESRRARDFFLAGVVLGVTGLTKSTPVIIAPFLFVYALFRGGEERFALCRNVVILWIGLGLVLTPWVARNYAISGEIIPSMTIKGAAAYQGLFLSQHGLRGEEFHQALALASQEQKAMAADMGLEFWRREMLPIFYATKDEVEFDDHLYRLVIEEYQRAPLLFVENVAQNTWRFWLQGRTGASTVMNSIVTVPLLALTLVGVALGFRRRLGLELVVLFAVLYYLAHLPLVAFAKYHVPLIPFMAAFASVAISGPLASALARWEPRLPPPGNA